MVVSNLQFKQAEASYKPFINLLIHGSDILSVEKSRLVNDLFMIVTNLKVRQLALHWTYSW